MSEEKMKTFEVIRAGLEESIAGLVEKSEKLQGERERIVDELNKIEEMIEERFEALVQVRAYLSKNGGEVEYSVSKSTIRVEAKEQFKRATSTCDTESKLKKKAKREGEAERRKTITHNGARFPKAMADLLHSTIKGDRWISATELKELVIEKLGYSKTSVDTYFSRVMRYLQDNYNRIEVRVSEQHNLIREYRLPMIKASELNAEYGEGVLERERAVHNTNLRGGRRVN